MFLVACPLPVTLPTLVYASPTSNSQHLHLSASGLLCHWAQQARSSWKSTGRGWCINTPAPSPLLGITQVWLDISQSSLVGLASVRHSVNETDNTPFIERLTFHLPYRYLMTFQTEYFCSNLHLRISIWGNPWPSVIWVCSLCDPIISIWKIGLSLAMLDNCLLWYYM